MATVDEDSSDTFARVVIDGNACVLPFHLTDVIRNLREERYVPRQQVASWKKIVRQLYYLTRPLLPVGVRQYAQRFWLKGWSTRKFPQWPVDRTVDQLLEQVMVLLLQRAGMERIPFIWFWPRGKSSCAIVTHDVEEAHGLQFCPALMDIDDSFGIKSSFQLIPAARYHVSASTISTFKKREFEINVHDLKHDGRLFLDDDKFPKRAQDINHHLVRFNSNGFRSGVLYRDINRYNHFAFSFDMSVPNVAHLDPQPGGCCTVMPFFIGEVLELPLTTVQDYSLFHILNTYSTSLWRQQIALIRQQHGLMSFNIHPDYLRSGEAIAAYKTLLAHLASLRSNDGVWIALPGEVNTWWRQRRAMRLISSGDSWRVDGLGAERAQVAYASVNDGRLTYSFE